MEGALSRWNATSLGARLSEHWLAKEKVVKFPVSLSSGKDNRREGDIP
jgi:hypothetical protein